MVSCILFNIDNLQTDLFDDTLIDTSIPSQVLWFNSICTLGYLMPNPFYKCDFKCIVNW